MNPTWKPRFEALEAREVPALFKMIPMAIVYPPSDPTAPVVTTPTPTPAPTPIDPGTVISLPVPAPYVPPPAPPVAPLPVAS